MREIGSEYWLEYSSAVAEKDSFYKLVDFGRDKKFLYTGRTAIDYVLEDVIQPISSVYMPSYCCSSMLQPFLERGIRIEFYQVTYNSNGIIYDIDFNKDVDIFFANSYFGYSSTVMDDIIREYKKKNIIVMEDITHRLLTEKNNSGLADYYIASLRKWFPIPSGGLAVKQNGSFKEIPLLSPPHTIIKKKNSAMIKKREYMSDITLKEKSGFLSLFAEFNNDIRNNYKSLLIDDLSYKIISETNITQLKHKRKENVKFIYTNLKAAKGITFLINESDYHNDCLLFVPIMVKHALREQLRKHLISKSIYCPIHWPVPSLILSKELNSNLYENELSLICDQRYGLSDMNKIIETIGEFQSNL